MATTLEKLNLQRAARSPEGQLLIQHLMAKAQEAIVNQNELVFKGMMMAIFTLKQLADKEKIAESRE